MQWQFWNGSINGFSNSLNIQGGCRTAKKFMQVFKYIA